MTPNQPDEIVGLCTHRPTPLLDPYLDWAQKTEFRDYGGKSQDDWIAVAIECNATVRAFSHVVRKLPWINIARAYRTLRGPLAQTTFCTATVKRSHLNDLAAIVKRFELGLAIVPWPSNRKHRPPPSLSPWSGLLRRVVIGVMDDFVGFANADLSDSAGRSRVIAVWHQERLQALAPNARPHWTKVGTFDYGYELLDLSGIQANGVALTDLYPSNLPARMHGSHVASLCAGRVDHNADLGAGGPENGFANRSDAAADAPIIAVHFPRKVVEDTSGGAMSVQVLDGVHYILNRAGPNSDVVINLSYGTYAGPHDGTSILEAALDELTRLRAGSLVLVVPSGNQYESRCHARFDLDPTRPSQTLQWQVLPDSLTPSFMEIWMPADAVGKLCVQVTSPDGEASPPVRVGNSWRAKNIAWNVGYPQKVPNGVHGTMVLIALAPTSCSTVAQPCAPHGMWRVLVQLTGTHHLKEIHAWVERNDYMKGYRRAGRQSFIANADYEKLGQRPGQPSDDDASSAIKRRGSFNTIATGSETIVVGGYVGKSLVVAPYSGGGPTLDSLRSWPDVLAVSEATPTRPGLRGAGAYGSTTFRMKGTSVAAPQVTRRIVNLLASTAPSPITAAGGAPDMLRKLGAMARASAAEKAAASMGLPRDASREGFGRLDF